MSAHAPLIEGYVVCPRACHDTPELVRKEVAQHTDGICTACFVAEGGKRITKIELVMEGRRVRIPKQTKPARKRYRPHRNAHNDQNAKARDRARKRVADMFPDLYDVLLSQEREKLGLDPWPTAIAVRSGTPTPDLERAERIAGLR